MKDLVEMNHCVCEVKEKGIDNKAKEKSQEKSGQRFLDRTVIYLIQSLAGMMTSSLLPLLTPSVVHSDVSVLSSPPLVRNAADDVGNCLKDTFEPRRLPPIHTHTHTHNLPQEEKSLRRHKKLSEREETR